MAKGSEKKIRKKLSASKKCSNCESLTETIKVHQEINLALQETVRELSERLQWRKLWQRPSVSKMEAIPLQL